MTLLHIKEIPATVRLPSGASATERVVDARELLGGGRRVWVEHGSQRYLLQLTRSGKLILTK